VHRSLLGTQFGAQRPHHPHRGGLLFRTVSACRRLPRRLFFRHTCILVSKVRSLQHFQGDSPGGWGAGRARWPGVAGYRVCSIGNAWALKRLAAAGGGDVAQCACCAGVAGGACAADGNDVVEVLGDGVVGRPPGARDRRDRRRGGRQLEDAVGELVTNRRSAWRYCTRPSVGRVIDVPDDPAE